MKLQELTPEQVVFLSALLEKIASDYTNILDKGGIEQTISLPMIGEMTVFKKLDEEGREFLEKNKRFVFTKKLLSKFKPISDFIKEATPDVYDEAYYLIMPTEAEQAEKLKEEEERKSHMRRMDGDTPPPPGGIGDFLRGLIEGMTGKKDEDNKDDDDDDKPKKE